MENDNKKILNKTDLIMEQVSDITSALAERTKRIDFKAEALGESEVTDLKLHLGYAKNYSDLAKTRLQYHKVFNLLPLTPDEEDED